MGRGDCGAGSARDDLRRHDPKRDVLYDAPCRGDDALAGVARAIPEAAVAGAGLVFGLATLIRPVTSYLILLIVPADMWLRRRRAASVLMSVWMLVGFAAPVGGWMLRNHQLTGKAVVSSIQDYNLQDLLGRGRNRGGTR